MAGGYTNLDKVKLTPGGYRRVQQISPPSPTPEMFIPSDSEEEDAPPSYQVFHRNQENYFFACFMFIHEFFCFNSGDEALSVSMVSRRDRVDLMQSLVIAPILPIIFWTTVQTMWWFILSQKTLNRNGATWRIWFVVISCSWVLPAYKFMVTNGCTSTF